MNKFIENQNKTQFFQFGPGMSIKADIHPQNRVHKIWICFPREGAIPQELGRYKDYNDASKVYSDLKNFLLCDSMFGTPSFNMIEDIINK